MKQVYLRRPQLGKNSSALVLADVLSVSDTEMRVKVHNGRQIVTVPKDAVISVGAVRPGSISRNPRQPRSIPRRQFPTSNTALGNRW